MIREIELGHGAIVTSRACLNNYPHGQYLPTRSMLVST
jgi:hypothetical protein